MTDQIRPPTYRQRLPAHILADIVEFETENNLEATEDLKELIDRWMHWNGIIGYAHYILDFIEALEVRDIS